MMMAYPSGYATYHRSVTCKWRRMPNPILTDLDVMVEEATLGSDTIRSQIKTQTYLTYLQLLHWRNGEGNRDSMRLKYIRELEKLRTLTKIRQQRQDSIWTVIDSIELVECIDSITRLELMAIKFMAKDSLTEDEQTTIDSYARRCARNYGRGIHVMRALAASFSDEDYRKYDYDCGATEEEQLEYRDSNPPRSLTIVPNPSTGIIRINVPDNELARKLIITDLVGTNYYISPNPEQSQEITLNQSGIYIAHVLYKDGNTATQRFIIVD